MWWEPNPPPNIALILCHLQFWNESYRHVNNSNRVSLSEKNFEFTSHFLKPDFSRKTKQHAHKRHQRFFWINPAVSLAVIFRTVFPQASRSVTSFLIQPKVVVFCLNLHKWIWISWRVVMCKRPVEYSSETFYAWCSSHFTKRQFDTNHLRLLTLTVNASLSRQTCTLSSIFHHGIKQFFFLNRCLWTIGFSISVLKLSIIIVVLAKLDLVYKSNSCCCVGCCIN
jgi:hypothetical protein